MGRLKTKIIPVNLQQGIVIVEYDTHTEVVAAYSHHRKNIAVKLPYNLSDINVPPKLEKYTFKSVHSIGLDCYGVNGRDEI